MSLLGAPAVVRGCSGLWIVKDDSSITTVEGSTAHGKAQFRFFCTSVAAEEFESSSGNSGGATRGYRKGEVQVGSVKVAVKAAAITYLQIPRLAGWACSDMCTPPVLGGVASLGF